MNIDAICNGIVIDHIAAGKSMEIYKLLNLDQLECSVAIIKNVNSKKMGKKDIIKIDSAIPLNLDVVGFVDPDATINIIRDGEKGQKGDDGTGVNIKGSKTLDKNIYGENYGNI